LVKMKIYLDYENHGRVEKILRKIISFAPEKYFFDYEYSYGKEKKIHETVVSILSNIEEKIKNKQLFTMFIFYLYNHSGWDMKALLDDEFDVPSGRNKVLDLIRSPNFGLKYPIV